MFKIETKRLIIRDMTPNDEDAFVTMSQDAKYQRFYDESDCDPNKYRELTRLFIAQVSEKPRKSYQLAVECKVSGEFVGTVCLRLEDNQQASMGGVFSRVSQGNKLSHEAALAWQILGSRRIWYLKETDEQGWIKIQSWLARLNRISVWLLSELPLRSIN